MESKSHSSKSIGDPNSQHPSIDGVPSSTTTPATIPTSSETLVDDASVYDPKRLKSMVWQHFKKKMINGEWKAICNYCKRKLGGKSKSGTSHLHDHLKRFPNRTHKDLTQQLLLANQSKVDGTTKLINYAFNHNLARKELSHMIIMHEYPFSMVDYTGFRKYYSIL